MQASIGGLSLPIDHVAFAAADLAHARHLVGAGRADGPNESGEAEGTVAEAASPLSHVRSDAPPMLLMVADGDTELRREQNIRMFEAMKGTGHPAVEFHILEDRTHSSIGKYLIEEGDPAMGFMLDFIDKHDAGP